MAARETATIANPPRFLLAGNSSYQNRGCEAIIRGTTAILRRSFGAGVHFAVAQFGDKHNLETPGCAGIRSRDYAHFVVVQKILDRMADGPV